jgi:hypothetical protein
MTNKPEPKVYDISNPAPAFDIESPLSIEEVRRYIVKRGEAADTTETLGDYELRLFQYLISQEVELQPHVLQNVVLYPYHCLPLSIFRSLRVVEDSPTDMKGIGATDNIEPVQPLTPVEPDSKVVVDESPVEENIQEQSSESVSVEEAEDSSVEDISDTEEEKE